MAGTAEEEQLVLDSNPKDWRDRRRWVGNVGQRNDTVTLLEILCNGGRRLGIFVVLLDMILNRRRVDTLLTIHAYNDFQGCIDDDSQSRKVVYFVARYGRIIGDDLVRQKIEFSEQWCSCRSRYNVFCWPFGGCC